MASDLILTCDKCQAISRWPTNRSQQDLECRGCGRRFHGIRVETCGGYVYVLSNPAMPGLLKIGRTDVSPIDRAQELSSATGVPEPYVVEAYFTCADSAAVESGVHVRLARNRKPSREFFELSIDAALATIEELVGKAPDFAREQIRRQPAPSARRDSWSPVRGNRIRIKGTCGACGQSFWFPPWSPPSACPNCAAPLDQSKSAT
jgi:hypothetical protein